MHLFFFLTFILTLRFQHSHMEISQVHCFSKPYLLLLFDVLFPMCDHIVAIAETLFTQVANERPISVLK